MRLTALQIGCAAALLSSSLSSSPASAHFRLLKPAPWVTEDGLGNPQKASPCGVAKGDNSAPVTGAVTTFKAGETITVEWVDTIAHPGYFRIALAADRDELKDPTVKQGFDCSYDESLTPKSASGNVLADGIFFRSRMGFSESGGKMFSQKITLPDQP
ncbi:MAG TPA: SCE4755 family polysaccharide monooxygenase-like protein, partial [Polyangiales bacterium]